MSSEHQDEQEKAITTIFNIYSSFAFKPPPKQFTVLAAFYLSNSARGSVKVISVSTGTKCIPAIKYSPRGELVHDSHAEVLARRGAMRWFLEEISRTRQDPIYASEWVIRDDSLEGNEGIYRLRDEIDISMYVSTLPCGDASMRYLASIQEPAMAALKSSNSFPALAPNAASRGRDNYARLGVLRTKPGRADSPPALSMSCSDKMARWCVLGMQGSLCSRFMKPVYLRRIVLGEVSQDEEVKSVIREDCERAFWKRIEDVKGLPDGYRLRPPDIHLTEIPFIHSKNELDKGSRTTGSCNESLCWVADSQPMEILINGLKRSTSPKNRYLEKYRPLLSRIALFNLYHSVLQLEGLPIANALTYACAKASSRHYQQAKALLIGPDGLFSGWIKLDLRYQQFTIDGEYHDVPTSAP